MVRDKTRQSLAGLAALAVGLGMLDAGVRGWPTVDSGLVVAAVGGLISALGLTWAWFVGHVWMVAPMWVVAPFVGAWFLLDRSARGRARRYAWRTGQSSVSVADVAYHGRELGCRYRWSSDGAGYPVVHDMADPGDRADWPLGIDVETAVVVDTIAHAELWQAIRDEPWLTAGSPEAEAVGAQGQ